jgi:hypothetical protein
LNGAGSTSIFRLNNGSWKVIAMPEGVSVLIFSAVFCVVMIIWIARCAVHTQAMLAAHQEHDWLVDTFVWINRQLTGRPRRQR